ncbi:MAG: signal transduction histidine kinase, partial [Myxococcota bacterium]
GSYFASVTAFSLASHGTATGAVLSLILVAPLGFLAPGVVWPSLWATLVCIQISLTPMMSQLPFEQLITTDPETARLALYQLPVLITIFTLAGGLLTNTILRHGDRRKQQAQRYMVELNVEKERLEEAMLERQKNLASVGTLAASVAHQINNPVGSILAAAQFALITKGDADYDEVASDAFVTIAAEAKRCGQIVHSLLRLSVGEHGEVWEEDIHGVVESAYNATRPYAQELGAELDLKLTETSSRLLISPIELEQAIVNLIRNGLEARTTGARVVVRTVSDTVSVRIQVVDNGTGLADPENAFDAFYTTRAAAGGTGLGLTVVRGIVEEHGGSVRAFPLADGPGTIFEIELPRHRVTDDCGSS